MPTLIDPKGLCVRLGFRGYRIFVYHVNAFNIHGKLGGLTYQDYDIRNMDVLAKELGYFPNAKEVGDWYVDLLTKHEQKRTPDYEIRLAFVNNGEYWKLYENPWYAEFKKNGFPSWLTMTGNVGD